MTRKIATATATATATTINPADIATLFARAYMGEVTRQDDLKAAYEAAVTASRATQLTNMLAIAEGKPAINSEAFDADYKVAMRAALVASGKYTDGSVNTVYGRCRTAYLGMVNNIMPVTGENIAAYAGRIGDELVTRGIFRPKAGRAGGRPEGTTKAAASQSRAPKMTDNAENADEYTARDMCEALCGGDMIMARDLEVMLAKHTTSLAKYMRGHLESMKARDAITLQAVAGQRVPGGRISVPVPKGNATLHLNTEN
jgi:hypothetical protein